MLVQFARDSEEGRSPSLEEIAAELDDALSERLGEAVTVEKVRAWKRILGRSIHHAQKRLGSEPPFVVTRWVKDEQQNRYEMPPVMRRAILDVADGRVSAS
jgi:hypothetical protein